MNWDDLFAILYQAGWSDEDIAMSYGTTVERVRALRGLVK